MTSVTNFWAYLVCQEVAVLVNRAALDRQVLAPKRHERN